MLRFTLAVLHKQRDALLLKMPISPGKLDFLGKYAILDIISYKRTVFADRKKGF